MTRHVIRTDRSCELGVSQHAHNREEVHRSFIRINLLKMVQATANVAHVNLMDFSAPAQVFDDGQDLRAWIFQPFSRRSETQLESVVRAVHNSFVTFNGLEDRGRIPVIHSLITKRKARRIVWVTRSEERR